MENARELDAAKGSETIAVSEEELTLFSRLMGLLAKTCKPVRIQVRRLKCVFSFPS